jgi:hypothetical protein
MLNVSTDPNNPERQGILPPDSAPSIADEKTRLECEKLKAEIETLRKPFYRTTGFYSAMLPVLLAALGLLWSWSSGWFDVQRTRVENEKKLVEVQTEALKVERSRLSRETEEQQKHVAALEREDATLRDTEVALTNQIARLERDRNEMRAAKQFFEGEARRLAGSETNALYLFTQLQTAQALREKLAGDNQKLQATNDALHITVAGQEALLRRATELLLQPALSLLIDDFSLEGAHSHFDKVLRWQADLETAQNDREASSNVLNAITFYATNWPKAVKTRK